MFILYFAYRHWAVLGRRKRKKLNQNERLQFGEFQCAYEKAAAQCKRAKQKALHRKRHLNGRLLQWPCNQRKHMMNRLDAGDACG